MEKAQEAQDSAMLENDIASAKSEIKLRQEQHSKTGANLVKAKKDLAYLLGKKAGYSVGDTVVLNRRNATQRFIIDGLSLWMGKDLQLNCRLIKKNGEFGVGTKRLYGSDFDNLTIES